MIRVEGLSFSYETGQAPSLNIPDLIIDEGEYVAVIGPNGCGKTTLIRHFNALLLPDAGVVQIDGLNTSDSRNLTEIRRLVGMIFQNPDNQIVGMSVEEDVAFGPGNLGLPATEIRRRVDNAIQTVGLAGLETRSPHTLSGGQKQLLALAGLLAMSPRFIVLDEPTSSLDPAGKKNVLAQLKRLQRQGIGIIQVTQCMDEAVVADRVLVLDKGELVADGKPGDIFSRVQWLRALGMDPPQVAELMWQLNQRGEDVSKHSLTVDEAVDEIASLLAELRNATHACVHPGR
jgi:biotin transport system ATP-binding protein/energy-coupling factor transport system ATP-binding protein